MSFRPIRTETSQTKTLEKLNKSIKELKDREKILKLKIEQSKLMDNDKRLKKLIREMNDIQKKKYQFFRKKISLTFLLFSHALKHKNKKTFTYKKSMVEFIQAHHHSQYHLVADDLKSLFRAMEKALLGTIATFKGESFEEIKTQLLNIWEVVNQPLFSINKTPISIFKLIISLIIFIIGLLLSFINIILGKIAIRSRTITESTQTLLSNIGTILYFDYSIWVSIGDDYLYG